MRKLLSAAVVVLWALPSFAATPPGVVPSPLDMAGAVAIALEKNSDVAALREELEGIRVAAELSGTLPNPVLELEGASGAFTKSPDERSIGIALSQEIPLVPVGARRKAFARAEAEVMLARLRDYERRVTEQAQRAWLDATMATRRVELAQGQEVVAEELLVASKTRFQVGDLPEFEVQLADLDLRKSGLRHGEAVAAAEGARRRLALLLGFNNADELPPLADVSAPQTDHRPADDALLAAALERRPDLAAQKREGEREEAALALAKAEAVPPVMVSIFSRNERSSQNTYELDGALLVPGTEQTRDRVMGVKLSLPLPVFSRNQAESAKASARVSAARLRLEGVKRTVASEVRDLLAQYRLALTAFGLHRTALGPVARENLKIQQEAFALGEIGMQLVLDEKRRLSEQQEAELTALQAALESRCRLESAVGGVLANINGVAGEKP
ncbi:MAG: TolC family protein [Proteobacteria bacterium]|nr:TolC family protein [Pseudomonadota bacterium]MBU1547812.1 TolC family protein [Pseudomonadota bacterium]MBU2618555.1 TolC family protein [Pseudomonadota bacterium]